MYYRFSLAALMALLLVLAGCAFSPPSQFYLLSPIAPSQKSPPVSETQNSLLIGVGPVQIPAYLNRPQMVTRVNPNQLNLSEFERWAEPLEDSVSRILMENLARLLPAQGFSFNAWTGSSTVDYTVTVEVVRFDGQKGGEAVLIAQWSIFDGTKSKMIATNTSTIREAAQGGAAVDLVAAQSRALAKLSRQIAPAIAKLAK